MTVVKKKKLKVTKFYYEVNVDHVVKEDDEPLNPVICFEYT